MDANISQLIGECTLKDIKRWLKQSHAKRRELKSLHSTTPLTINLTAFSLLVSNHPSRLASHDSAKEPEKN